MADSIWTLIDDPLALDLEAERPAVHNVIPQLRRLVGCAEPAGDAVTRTQPPVRFAQWSEHSHESPIISAPGPDGSPREPRPLIAGDPLPVRLRRARGHEDGFVDPARRNATSLIPPVSAGNPAPDLW
jgi:hypothetical protein